MTIALWPEFVMANDLSPDAFGEEVDAICEDIEKATKGFGANRQQVIDALATQDPTTRAKVSMRYMELYGDDHKKFKSMADLMAHEFSGDMGTALEYLALPTNKAECLMIKKACKGVGAHVDAIWSILAGRTNDEMEMLKKTYFQMYDKDLGQVLAGELHGNMERLAFNCLQAAEEVYDPEFHTLEKAREDAEIIYDAGQGCFGTDEKGLYKCLCAAPPEYLELINEEYTDKYGYTLWKALEKELGGVGEKNLRQASVYLVNMKLKPYFAMLKLIEDACKGFGTDEDYLTCCIIRFQPHLANINALYIEENGKPLHDLIRSEAGGKYKKLLLAIVNAVMPEGM